MVVVLHERARTALQQVLPGPAPEAVTVVVGPEGGFSDREIVRRRTVQTLRETSFPMLQVALIDFLVDIKDTSAANALRQLADDPGVNESVRSRAAWGLQRLSS